MKIRPYLMSTKEEKIEMRGVNDIYHKTDNANSK